MRDLAILFIHLFATIARLMRPGGGRAVVAESLLVKHQLVILNRGRERAPNLRPMDRVMADLCTLFIRPGRLLRIAVVLRPSTLLAFHASLVKRKYRQLFSPKRRGKPGPKDLHRNSSRPLWKPRDAIRAGAVAESHNNFVLCSTLRSIRTWCDVC